MAAAVSPGQARQQLVDNVASLKRSHDAAIHLAQLLPAGGRAAKREKFWSLEPGYSKTDRGGCSWIKMAQAMSENTCSYNCSIAKEKFASNRTQKSLT